MSETSTVTTSSDVAAAPLSDADLTRFASSFAADPVHRIAQNAVTRVGADEAALDRSIVNATSHTVSNRLDDWKVTNQRKSGRCWLFSSLNLLRVGAKKRLGVKEFEFSQNYAVYCDKLERANYFLESVIATVDRPVDDRLVSFLMSTVLGDGGQWNMAVSIYQKYGVLPKEAMPETEGSSNTHRMNTILQSVLRQGAKTLRDAALSGTDAAGLRELKLGIVETVHRVLNIHLGTPPTSFDWEWTDDEKVFHRDGTLTPQEFFEKYVALDLDDYVCLVDDPRPEHPKGRTETVEHLGNVVGGSPVRYLNVDIATAKALARDTIVDGEPVWFGCDVAPMMQRKDGIWDAKLYDYAGIYDTEFTLTKEDRVNYGDSAMTHAMLLVGVDVADDGSSRRWRVENSWGDAGGQAGFYTMNDNWFDEYVFEVVVNKNRLSPELRAALDEEPIVLPAWDPMGALA